jgi:hypothetical protein
MSEYQYYEFQAIDRPLTEEEQQAVAQLSSRVDPHPRRAVFTYNWSSFPGRAEEVMAKYYDAMLYMANWGSRQLMFRFPQSLIDLERVGAFCHPLYVDEYVSFSTVGEHVLLKVKFREERGDWIEGEGWLDPLISLREDILQGDDRALYLAWLKALEVEDVLDSVTEPPVPPGLQELSPALRSFVDFFEVDALLVQVAARSSGERRAVPDGWLHGVISQLSRGECDAFLLRLAQGEPYLSVQLNRRLREFAPPSKPDQRPRRTVGQLLEAVKQERVRVRRKQAEEAETRRIRAMEALAEREDQTWQEVDALIQRSNAKAYDRAVQLLLKLRELATYQRQEMAFQGRLNHIYDRYTRRHSLLQRLRDAGLHQT